ncbi:hypothetical protein Ari01nite_50890 [Paractinoplanes rishiriensis]|uniref:Uncharacterized protein n=1 Tax=Paractinoplanes rishiriensis TaxID=1050105 RepID=A0A919K2H4_9ACTN|nr:hypothetical protein Ari01nite_50890 [Actinoplanes rishiriensis]
MTRSRVSRAIGTRVGALLSTRDTVLCETPDAAAMSRMVTGTRPVGTGVTTTGGTLGGSARAPGAEVGIDGSLTSSERRVCIRFHGWWETRVGWGRRRPERPAGTKEKDSPGRWVT